MKKPIIVPAILAKDADDFTSKLDCITPYFKRAQIDIMDGTLVPNTSFHDVKKIKTIKTTLDYELHLMVNDPRRYIRAWGGYPRCKLVIFHIEATKSERDIYGIIRMANQRGMRAGIALNPDTSLERIHRFVPHLNAVLLMGVTPGKSGQRFIKNVHSKIIKARQLYPSLDIEVDGGVNEKNAPRIVKEGANILASASMVFSSTNIPLLKKRVGHAKT